MKLSDRTYTEQIRQSDEGPGPYDIPDQPRKRRKKQTPFWESEQGKEIEKRSNEMFGRFEKEM